jgi:hypothetical protein
MNERAVFLHDRLCDEAGCRQSVVTSSVRKSSCFSTE